MARRLAALMVVSLLAGCASEPEPRHPTAEELSVAFSPGAEVEAEETPPSDDDRQSRPASSPPAPRRDANITPARWDGTTAAQRGSCLPAGGCLTLWLGSADDTQRVALDGRVWNVRVTVTWDAVDDATRELSVRALGMEVVGPSPLVLEAKYRSEEEGFATVRVESVQAGLVYVTQAQDFSAIAQFNV